MKKISTAVLFLLCLLITAQEKKFCFYFSPGKKVPVNFPAFEDSITKWKAVNNLQIVKIVGHTDNVGRASFNKLLSINRAMSVEKLISGLNLQANAKISGLGESQPAYSNLKKEGRAKNRRTEITVLIQPKISKKEMVVEPQTIKPLCNEHDTVIVLPEGTEIELKGCSLDGVSLKDIKVEAREFLTRDQMILNDMYTQTSDGTCLSTGGMLSFKITDKDGNPVKLKQSSNVIIRIPQTAKDTAFDLYQMGKNGKGENDGWNKRNDTVKYLRQLKKFEIRSVSPAVSLNLDFVPLLGNAIAKQKQDRVKTKVVKNATTYINGETSVLKLNRYKPRKFKYRNCNCIPESEQFATIIAQKNNQIYYCHKQLKELKLRWFFGKKYVVRKRDYIVLNSNKELALRLKSDLVSR